MTQKIIHFRGNATGYLHYLGYGLYLRAHYNLEDIKFSGCSSGAIISTIMSLDVDFTKAAVVLFQVQPKSKSQFALVGNWKRRIKLYFEEIFPNDYDYEAMDSLRVGVQFLTGFQFVEKFHSKSDLINCLLASTHIPFVMNFKPFEKFRGRVCVDGDFLRSYERSKQKEGFFISYEMPFIQSISLKNESDYMQLIKEGYQAAAANADLNNYLKEYRTNKNQDKPLLDFLKTIQKSFVLNFEKELKHLI